MVSSELFRLRQARSVRLTLLIFLLIMGCKQSGTTTDLEYQTSVREINLTEIFRMGDSEGDVVLFREISDLDVNSRGDVFVVDAGNKSVHAFTEEGRVLRDLGRSGRGPGEFVGPSSVYVTKSDSVYILDRILSRVSVFDPETLAVLRTFSVLGNYSVGLPSSLLGSGERGVLIKYITPFVDPTQFATEEFRYDKIYLVDFQGNRETDPILEVLASDFITTTSERGGISAQRLPFGRSPVVRYNHYNGYLYSGRNSSIDIDLVSVPDGSTIKSFQLAISNMPITESDRDSVLSNFSSEVQRERALSVEWPESYPAFETFVVSDDSYIWLKRTMPSPSTNAEWLIMDKTGELSAIAYLPKEVIIDVVKQDRAYGYAKDRESGAPYVISFKID